MANARLPIPGQDGGTWGSILNEYLTTSLAADGTIKNDVIGTAQLAPNSVTSTSLAPNSVTATQIADNTISSAAIADGSITETLLATSVVTKLNQSGVIADGAITKSKLEMSVQTSLTKADSALQAVTKADVGLGNVDNTADVSKPVSTAMQTALDAKASASSLATVATTGSYADLLNKPTIPAVPVTSVATRTGDIVLTKSDVGLGNVDNTSDTSKPISTATQTALNLKANTSSLSTVATTGSYADLSSKPTIPTAGTAAGTYAAGNDSRITGALQSGSTATGDLSGSFPGPTVAKVNGVEVSGAAASGTTLIATSSTAAAWTQTATVDVTNAPQPLGVVTPGTGSSGVSASDHVHAMPALSSLTDQDMTNIADGTVPTWNAAAGKFKQAVPASGTTAPIALWTTITSGITTLPRTHQDDSGSFGSTPASGTEHFTFFRADKSMSVGHIQFQTGGTAAASSTYAGVGLYTVSGSTLTLVASSANKTTFSGSYGVQSCALTSAYSVTSGVIYAVGMLQVASTPGSVLGAWFNGAFMGSAPLLAGTLASQTTVASSASSLSTNQFPIYYELVA